MIGSIVAEPVGADDVHLGDPAKAGVVVGSSETVVLLDLDGTILATLHGYEVGGNLGAPGVWLKRGPKYFELDIAHGLLMHVGEDRARDVTYDEGPGAFAAAASGCHGSGRRCRGPVEVRGRIVVGRDPGAMVGRMRGSDCLLDR